jgi:hypothetical protein
MFDGCYVVRGDVPAVRMDAHEWHALQRLAPVLKTHDVTPQTRWSIDYVIERLKSIRQERRTRAGAEWYACTKPDAEQREMPAALGVTL